MKRKFVMILVCAFLFNILAAGALWADDDWGKKFIPPGHLKNGKFYRGELPPPFQSMYENWNGELPPQFQNILADCRGEIEGEIVYKTTLNKKDWIVVQSDESLKTFILESTNKFSVGDWVEVEYFLNRVIEIEKEDKDDKDDYRYLLDYYLNLSPSKVYEGEKLTFKMEVKNNTKKDIETRFNSGQRYDFVVKKDGKKVWRWSDDYDFITVIQNLTFKPGKVETYTGQWVPNDPGNYTVEAYFMGESSTKPVLVQKFTVLEKEERNLQYNLEVIKGEPNLFILRVTNPLNTNLTVTTPTGQIYDFLLTKEGKEVWQWSDDRKFTQAEQKLTFAPKETKVYYAQYSTSKNGDYELFGFFKGDGNKKIGPEKFTIK